MNRRTGTEKPLNRPAKRTQNKGTIGLRPNRTSAAGRCIVVGVGASAGALEAFTQFLKALPEEPGFAFVLIPHLDPDHESVMSELLARDTVMPVREAREGLVVSKNAVYVIPPNRTMTIRRGILHLENREPRPTPAMPIDTFFHSLAEDCGHNAVGIVLSGTASDGTLGIAAIKNEGGITFAQDSSAKFDQMPNSAIASGNVDFILPPDGIAKELLRVSRHPYIAAMSGEAGPQGADYPNAEEFKDVFRILKESRHVDFSDYKAPTIRRRILRRMALMHVENAADYVRILKRNPVELEALHGDILINVTRFFRDPDAFEALREIVYPRLLHQRSPSDAIRVWVPGCSTGEEVYSHAIALVEYLSRIRSEIPFQIFGTDLSEGAVRNARAGIYKPNISADLSPRRLRRFLRKIDGGYQISKSIRDMCVFATQNVFNDPPFSRMDLVSCRNVLIYLGPTLQRRVFPILHYALKPSGFLMVGNSEAVVGIGADLFETMDKRHRIYSKKLVPSPVAFGISNGGYEAPVSSASPPRETRISETDPARAPLEVQREADRLLLSKFVPAAVVVNEQFDILQVRGKASRYLELPPGKPSLNLLKMAKSGLLFQLRAALQEAKKSGSAVQKYGVEFDMDGSFQTVSLEVIPFHPPMRQTRSFVIVFAEEEDKEFTRPPKPQFPETETESKKQILQLRQELAGTKEYLQSVIESAAASNEELQSANEEIQSGNEELQSTNEELQTSKEELESSNEELKTVNEEMQHRNLELRRANSDLENLLASVSIPILMLDADLCIRRMTPQAEELLGISAADLGRPMRHLHPKLNVHELEAMILDVIERLQARELYVDLQQNQEYRVRITPYRTVDNRIEGAVLACIDLRGTAQGPTGDARHSQRSGSKRRGK